MSEHRSQTKILLDILKPEKCDCVELDNLARAYDAAVQAGLMDREQAAAEFSASEDPDCKGKKPNPSVIEGCGSPDKVCGHRKTAQFLIDETIRVRQSL